MELQVCVRSLDLKFANFVSEFRRYCLEIKTIDRVEHTLAAFNNAKLIGGQFPFFTLNMQWYTPTWLQLATATAIVININEYQIY